MLALRASVVARLTPAGILQIRDVSDRGVRTVASVVVRRLTDRGPVTGFALFAVVSLRAAGPLRDGVERRVNLAVGLEVVVAVGIAAGLEFRRLVLLPLLDRLKKSRAFTRLT